MTDEIKIGDVVHFKKSIMGMLTCDILEGEVMLIQGDQLVVSHTQGLSVVERGNLVSAEAYRSLRYMRDVETVKKFICAESVPDMPEVRALAKAIREQKQ